jgi:hypothetical protein
MTDDLEKWVEAIPAQTIESELDELRRTRRTIDQKIEVREQALAMKRAFAGERADGLGQSGETKVIAVNPPLRGREAIRRVLAATPEKGTWTIPEMLKAIHDRGWIANTHAVQVNLSRMYRDGELSKAGTGIYCRPDVGRSLLSSAQPEQG